MRNYKRRTERGTKTLEIMKEAAEQVIKGDLKLCQAAKQFDICRNSLKRFMSRYRQNPEKATFGYVAPRKIFTLEQEKTLTEYLLKLAQIFHGLGAKDVRRLAYECAHEYQLKMPEAWVKNKMAGEDWMSGFIRRNTSLSLRKPEATSLSRATSFNKTNVSCFFEKLASVMDRYKFTASSIWNLDETGVSTVMKPAKIVAAKGKRNIGSVTSGERGTNVTVVAAISATGSSIPPMFIFPRKKYHDYFVRGGPPDCIGQANGSGWITDEEFYVFLKHFIHHVKPSLDSPILLLLDNHSSHLNIKCLDLAKENGVVMLSFPPHCSHKLQPLDVSVFGPFKKHLSSAQDAWMRNNPAKTITIYDIPSIVSVALPLAFIPINIMKGFSATGIFPFNKDVFTEDDFAPSYVTDRPMTVEQNNDVSGGTEVENMQPMPINLEQSNIQDISIVDREEPQPSTSTGVVFSPESVRPFPKAGARKVNTRKRRRAAILTDTPERDALADEQSSSKKEKCKKIDPKKVKAVKKKILQDKDEFSSSDSQNECLCIVCQESYNDSKPGDDWIQCGTCREWAHEKCANIFGSIFYYTCINCESDND